MNPECDGVQDCTDDSDEDNCGKLTTHLPTDGCGMEFSGGNACTYVCFQSAG